MTKEEMAALNIPETLHENPTLKEIKDIPTLAQVAVDLKAYQGASIRIPGPDAGEPAHKEFREKLKAKVPDLVEVPSDPEKLAAVEESIFERLGKPKEAKGYPTLLEAKVELPEAVKVNEDELRAYATKLGMTKKQYVAFAKEVIAERTAIVSADSEQRKALRSELGEAFDDRLTAAANAAKKLGYSDARVEAIRTGRVSVEEAKAWINVAKSVGVEGSAHVAEGSGSHRMTPEEAKLAVEELYANPAIRDASHPQHKSLVEKLHKYTKIAHGL